MQKTYTGQEAFKRGLFKPGVKFIYKKQEGNFEKDAGLVGKTFIVKNVDGSGSLFVTNKSSMHFGLTGASNKDCLFEFPDLNTKEEEADFIVEEDGGPFDLNEYQKLFYKTFNSYKSPKESIIKKSMSKVTKFISRLNLSANDKLLLDAELEDPSGVPTDAGYEASHLISYKENREKLIAYAEEMKKQEKEDKK